MGLLKKIFLLLLLPTTTLASMILRCPTIEEVQFGRYYDWKPVYISNEQHASYDDIKRFEQTVTAFHSARWSSHYNRQAHCFYSGDNIITLTHWSSYPLQSRDWHWLQPERLAECMDDPFACQFIY